MAKLIFPAIIAKSYSGTISQYRQYVQEMAYFFRKSPKAAADLRNTLSAFAARIGLAGVVNGASVPVGDVTAVAGGQDNGTAAVSAGGTITRVTLPSTDKIIKSTVKYTAPAITGSYVNGYTFTIVAGVITAIVAS